MATTDDTHTPGYSAADSTDAILKRLRRVEGQVRGIAGMVEDVDAVALVLHHPRDPAHLALHPAKPLQDGVGGVGGGVAGRVRVVGRGHGSECCIPPRSMYSVAP